MAGFKVVVSPPENPVVTIVKFLGGAFVLFWIGVFVLLILVLAGFENIAGLAFLATLGIPGYYSVKRIFKSFRSDTEPPLELPQEQHPTEGTLLGTNVDTRQEVYLPEALRNRHLYLIGKTRTGKTTLIKNLILQDIEAGGGVAFIDPHGDAAVDLLGSIPKNRMNDVIYFDPTSEHSPRFNLLRLPYPAAKLTEDIISSIKMFFLDSWGPRLEHLFRYGVLTLLTDSEPHSIKDLRTIFINKEWREEVIERITTHSLTEFWRYEYDTLPSGSAHPLINKLSALLIPTSHFERIFSDIENDLDFPSLMNQGKIFIANLSKGMLGDEPSRFLGGLITTAIQQAALSRAQLSESERRPFYFYVDEFHNYTVSSFETILSESAKYKLNLTLANQSLGQLPLSLQRSIFGNVATIAAFQVSAEDARDLQREMHRSRYMAREKRTADFMPIDQFLRYQKSVYRRALQDRWLGLPVAERGKFGDKGIFDGIRANSGRRAEINRVLAALDGPLDVKFLRELFTDYEIRELTFPDVDDFLNIEPGYALCRIERADNVFALKTPSPPQSYSETRDAILRKASERLNVNQSRPLEQTQKEDPPIDDDQSGRMKKYGRRVDLAQDITPAQARKSKRPEH